MLSDHDFKRKSRVSIIHRPQERVSVLDQYLLDEMREKDKIIKNLKLRLSYINSSPSRIAAEIIRKRSGSVSYDESKSASSSGESIEINGGKKNTDKHSF